MDTIVITGCGWVTPFGAGTIREILAAATRVERPRCDYWPIPESLLQAAPGIASECRQDRGAHLAAVALEHARRDAKPNGTPVASDRVGMVLGCALAGQSGMIDFANDVRGQSARFVSPIRFPQTVGNYIAGALARAYDIRGPNSTIANGIASGLDAVIEGCAILAAGQAELIYAGGVDRLTPQLVSGLSRHGSQSSGPPAEAMFSDGACLFVLEREDSARQRGAGVLGLASEPRAAPLDAESPRSARADARPGEIRSVAGWRAPGAICIEDWIGRCLGALGAAALAAAVGALHGLPVPVPGSSGEARAVASPATDAAVIAGADGRETRLVITRGETEGPHHGR